MIPADIDRAACIALHGSFYPPAERTGVMESNIEAVAEALLAERQRCADLAMQTPLEVFATHMHHGMLTSWRETVKAAILGSERSRPS